METNPVELFDSATVAKMLGVKIETLEAWRCRGTGPAYIRVGRLPRYRPSAIEGYLQSRTRTPDDAA